MPKNLYNKDLLENAKENPYDLNGIHSDFISQNITNKFTYNTFEKIYSPDEERIIELIINIPFMQKVRYIPTYLYTFKQAWIQYICILVPVYLISRYVLYFLLDKNVFSSYTYGFNQSYQQVSLKHKIE